MSKLKKSKKDNIDTSLEGSLHSNKNGHDFRSNKSSHDYISNRSSHDYLSNKGIGSIGNILSRNREQQKKEIQVRAIPEKNTWRGKKALFF